MISLWLINRDLLLGSRYQFKRAKLAIHYCLIIEVRGIRLWEPPFMLMQPILKSHFLVPVCHLGIIMIKFSISNIDGSIRVVTASQFESKTPSLNRKTTTIKGSVSVITRAALIKKNKRTHISHPSCSQCAGVCARKRSSGGDNYTSSMTNHVWEHLASDCK